MDMVPYQFSEAAILPLPATQAFAIVRPLAKHGMQMQSEAGEKERVDEIN
jgi:hypothetical protein